VFKGRAVYVKKTERRTKQRYPIALRVRFVAIANSNSRAKISEVLRGAGETTNISSSGILFRSGIKVPAGSSIRVEVDWPFRSNEQSGPLSLIGSGRVIRSRQSHVAVRIGHYDFAHYTETASAADSRPAQW
jgi:hypothetical protein